jgi:hypothetical protein
MKRVTALVLSLGLMAGIAYGPLAQPTQASSLKVCGNVTVYVKATAVATGQLTINGILLVIVAGANLPASLAVGADVCVDLTTNALGLITGAALTANVHAHVKVCGTVTAYVAATGKATGLLKVGAHTFTLAVGSHLPASVDAGADLCIDLEVDGFGRVADGVVTANAHVHVKVCGDVTAYAAATASATGLLKIAGHTFVTAVDSHLPASIVAGADLCIDLTLDGYARVSDGKVTANAQAQLKVCGTITAYTAATATATGLLKIAGRTFVLAIDTDLPALVRVGADLCLDLTINGFGQVGGGSAVVNVTSTLDVCGKATAYAAATSTTDGSLAFAGVVRKIAAGSNLGAGIAVGAYLKLHLVLDVFGRIADATVLKVGVSVEDACGTGPQPTSEPGGATQAPGSTAGPGASAGPDASQQPGASQAPGASAAPSTGPGASPSPTDEAGGLTDCGGGVATQIGGGVAGLDDTLMPDTDALGRATGVVAANILPLIAIGLLGGMAAWYRTRRRPEDAVEGTGIGDGVSSTDETSEDRS